MIDVLARPKEVQFVRGLLMVVLQSMRGADYKVESRGLWVKGLGGQGNHQRSILIGFPHPLIALHHASKNRNLALSNRIEILLSRNE